MSDPEALLNFLTEKAGFCGCGQPDEAATFLFSVLDCIDQLQHDRDYSRLDKLIPDPGMRYFILYQLDNLGFLDHGGSVPGWLTQDGRDCLELLRSADA